MSNESNLDVQAEFNHIAKLVLSTWAFANTENFLSAAKIAFNQGLSDAQLWVDRLLSFRIGEEINGNNDFDPLCERRTREEEDGASFSLYDALCQFDDFLNAATDKLSRGEQRWGRWDYSKQAEALVKKLKALPTAQSYLPLKMPKSSSQAYIKNYEGFRDTGVRSDCSPVRLSYKNATHDKDNHGRSYFYTLFSTIYAYGLACAQEHNNRTLVATLKPIYLTYRDTEFSNTNGDEIMTMAREHAFMPLLEELEPFKVNPFIPEGDRAPVGQSPEAIARRKEESMQMVSCIIDELNDDEAEAQDNAKIDAIIAKHRGKIPLLKTFVYQR